MVLMKIYFAGSIRGGRDDADLYLAIINYLQEFGEVLTEHVGDSNLTSAGEQKSISYIHDRDVNWIKEANVIVAEVTMPSLGVGYEIAKATDLKKRVLCLFREDSGRSLSAMIGGCKDLEVVNYLDLESAKKEIKKFFENI